MINDEQNNHISLSTNSNSTSTSEQESNKNKEDIIQNNENQIELDSHLSPNMSSNNFSINNNSTIDKTEAEDNSPLPSNNPPGSEFSLTRKAIISSLSDKNTALMMQKIINEAPKEQIDNIVNELKGQYWELIREKNGNYFCSDLFRICDQKQRIMILNELTKTIADDCTDKFATHPIQTLIDFSSCEQEYKLILNSFSDGNKLFYASFDSFGSHVIQKIIEHIPEKFRMKFNLLFILIIPNLSLKQYGVCCVKKFVSFTKNEDIIDKVINVIRNAFVQIATNNYGNFLIQFMLKKLNNTKYGNKLKQAIRDNFKVLSENKYSYYICDLYLKFASKKEKENLMNIYSMNLFNNRNSSNLINNFNNCINNNTNNIFLNRQSNTPINFIGINNMINQNNQFPLNFFQQFNNYQYANNFKKGK